MSMHPPSSGTPVEFEPWMLTAYALRELTSLESALVERALDASPELRVELDAIRKTLGLVESSMAYSHPSANDPLATLTPHQQSIVTDAIAAVSTSAGDTSHVSLAALPFYRRRSFVAYLAAAACVPIGLLAWSSVLNSRKEVSYTVIEAPHYLDDDAVYSPEKEASDSRYQSLNAPSSTPSLQSSATTPKVEPNIGRKETVSSSADPERQSERSPEAGPRSGLAGNSSNETSSRQLPSIRHSGTTPTPRLPMYGGGQGRAEQPIVNSAGVQMDATSAGTTTTTLSDSSSFAHNLPTSNSAAPPAAGMAGGMGMGYGGSMGPENSGGYDSQPVDALYEGYSGESRLPKRLNPRSPQVPHELRNNLMFPLTIRQVRPSQDQFEAIVEKPFQDADTQPVTTFSIDVDTASYSKVRQTLQQFASLPSPDMVRIEEMLNYFRYDYAPPEGDVPFAASLKMAPCPWNPSHKLVRVGIQAKQVEAQVAPPCNLVFLLDVSGSMAQANKLPLVQRALSMLTERLREDDRVAIVVYAGAAGCILESTPGSEKEKIRSAIYNLQASGSTNGGEGIQLAYSIAKENFIAEGANRVILCTDGDFNVGTTSDSALVELVKEKAAANIFLTCLGFGAGNYNDSLMEKISKDGNGVYAMVDNDREAKKLMVDQLTGTLVTVAKDVKLQMDFNPNLVRSYRLIGYENRQLANADFSNDKKDAGDIGAGHSVTALYEIVPATIQEPDLTLTGSESKYQRRNQGGTVSTEVQELPVDDAMLLEWLTLKIRYKQPTASESSLLEFALANDSTDQSDSPELKMTDADLEWATAVAEFGLLLRKSKMAPKADWDTMLERARKAAGTDELRVECVELMRTAHSLANRSSIR